MTQAYIMCLLDYDFSILSNASTSRHQNGRKCFEIELGDAKQRFDIENNFEGNRSVLRSSIWLQNMKWLIRMRTKVIAFFKSL